MISGTSAGFGRRFAALIYDSLLLAALLLVYTGIMVAMRGGAITEAGSRGWWYLYRGGEVAIVAAYYVVNWMRSGQTLGMRAWHLRAVSESGKPLRLLPALWRCVCGFLAWAPAALGVFWLYADPERLALHDRLSGTRVVHLARS
ncbi:MAG TPA: RDD family protein [Steroidobacteraceae bacterium]